MLTPKQITFLSEAADASVICELHTKCPAQLSLAQAIFESGWGKACPGNNCFGIKATDSSLTYQITKEFLDGRWETMKLAFESYPTLSDCFTAHAKLLQGGPYLEAWIEYEVSEDVDELIVEISKHYATDPVYAQKIEQLAWEPEIVEAIQKARAT